MKLKIYPILLYVHLPLSCKQTYFWSPGWIYIYKSTSLTERCVIRMHAVAVCIYKTYKACTETLCSLSNLSLTAYSVDNNLQFKDTLPCFFFEVMREDLEICIATDCVVWKVKRKEHKTCWDIAFSQIKSHHEIIMPSLHYWTSFTGLWKCIFVLFSSYFYHKVTLI
jgi:hypothetical protein